MNYFNDRVYARRRLDGRLLRFDTRRDMVEYSRRENETPRSLPVITRGEFIRCKAVYDDPRWVRSVVDHGTSFLVERGGK